MIIAGMCPRIRGRQGLRSTCRRPSSFSLRGKEGLVGDFEGMMPVPLSQIWPQRDQRDQFVAGPRISRRSVAATVSLRAEFRFRLRGGVLHRLVTTNGRHNSFILLVQVILYDL